MNEVRISSLSCAGGNGVEASMEEAAGMIAEAASDKPDIICLPETFQYIGLTRDQKHEAAEEIGGRVTSQASELARMHHVNLLMPVYERKNGKVHNSMVWFDREGSVLGIYRKTFPTDYEMRDDITPGPLDFDVFHTEFGPIGCAICFDLCYKEVIERISSQEAKLVFFPSMFQGLDLMQAWAKLYRFYFVSCAGEPYSAVVNPIGHPVIKPWDHSSIMTLNINLDYVVIHGDYNRDKFSAVKAKYGPAVDINYIYIESAAMLSSRLPDVTAMDIVTEFDLELEKDYYTRSSKMRVDMLK